MLYVKSCKTSGFITLCESIFKSYMVSGMGGGVGKSPTQQNASFIASTALRSLFPSLNTEQHGKKKQKPTSTRAHPLQSRQHTSFLSTRHDKARQADKREDEGK